MEIPSMLLSREREQELERQEKNLRLLKTMTTTNNRLMTGMNPTPTMTLNGPLLVTARRRRRRRRRTRRTTTTVSYRLFLAYSISRYLVELLAVRPRFPFVGTVIACDHRSTYYSSTERGHTDRNLDSQGNLILHSEDFALEDGFSIEIKCLDRDCGFFSFTLDPFHCNDIITHTIRTTRSRQIELTFIPLHNAIQANVYVKLDLPSGTATSSSGTIYYVYGEITAHHKLYGRESVMLFSRGKESQIEVTDGKLPLSRNWTAVPIYLEPILIIKLNLCVTTNCDHGDEGRSFSF